MATPDRSPLLPAAFPSSQAGLAGTRNNAGSMTDLQHAVPNHHLSPVAPRAAHPLAGPFPGHPATTSISPRLSQKKSFHEPAMSSQSATHSPVPSAGPAPNSSGPAQFRRSHQNGVTSMSSLPGSPINNNNNNSGGAQPGYPSGGARRPSVMSTPRSSIPGPGSGLTPSMNNGMLTPDWSRTRGMSQQGLQGLQGPANVTPSSLAAQRLFHATGGPPHYPLGAMNPSLAAAASMSLPNLAALSLSPSLNAAAAAHAAAMHGTPSLISSPIIDTQDLHQMMMMQQNAIFGSPGSGLDLATFEQFQAMHQQQQQQQQQISSPLSNLQSPSLGGPSPNNRKLGLYKTELCRSWEEKGSCRYGTKCQFAHGPDELRAIPRHSKYKTEICRTFWLSGSCPYGRRCCFVHSTVPASGTAANVQASPNEFYTPQFGSEQPAEIIKLGDVVSANIKKSQQEEDPKKAALVGLGFEVPYSSEAEGAKIASGTATPGTNLRSALSVPTNLSSFAQAANMSAHKRFNEMLKADNDLLKADPFPAASSMGADQTPALSPAVSPKLGGPAPAKSETNEASIAATEASYPSPKDGQLRPPTPQPSRSLTSSPLLSSPAKRDTGNKLMGSPSLWGTDKKVW